jgi:cytochrome c oxidase subunit I+III
MPRRVYTYPETESWVGLNLLSSLGGFIMTIGFALVVIDLLAQLRYGGRVRRDPWQAGTLEWAMRIPPAPYAFASLPNIDTRADRIALAELAPSLARGEGYLGFVRNGWQEALGVHMSSGAPDQLIVLPSPTYLPLYTALCTAAAVLSMLFQFYLLALVFALLTAALFVLWGQKAGHARDYEPLPVGHGLSLPPHTEVTSTPPWLALITALVADGTLFTSLVFGVPISGSPRRTGRPRYDPRRTFGSPPDRSQPCSSPRSPRAGRFVPSPRVEHLRPGSDWRPSRCSLRWSRLSL